MNTWVQTILHWISVALSFRNPAPPKPSCLLPQCIHLLLLVPPHALNSPWLLWCKSSRTCQLLTRTCWRMRKSTAHSANETQPSARASDLGESKLRVQGGNEGQEHQSRLGHTVGAQRTIHCSQGLVLSQSLSETKATQNEPEGSHPILTAYLQTVQGKNTA